MTPSEPKSGEHEDHTSPFLEDAKKAYSLGFRVYKMRVISPDTIIDLVKSFNKKFKKNIKTNQIFELGSKYQREHVTKGQAVELGQSIADDLTNTLELDHPIEALAFLAEPTATLATEESEVASESDEHHTDISEENPDSVQKIATICIRSSKFTLADKQEVSLGLC